MGVGDICRHPNLINSDNPEERLISHYEIRSDCPLPNKDHTDLKSLLKRCLPYIKDYEINHYSSVEEYCEMVDCKKQFK